MIARRSLLAAVLLIALAGPAASQGCGTLSNCPFASTPLSGTELLYLVQQGSSKKITVTELAALFGGIVVNVLLNGATGNGIADDAPAIQRIVSSGNPSTPLLVYMPGTNACYRLGSAITVPPDRSVYFVGDGPERTQVLEANAASSALTYPTPASSPLWTGGGVHDMSIKAGSSCYSPGGLPGTIASTGTAISIQNGNNAITVDNVLMAGFGVGLNLDQTWQGYYTRLWGFDLGVGVQVGCNTAYPQGAGNHFGNLLFSENGLASGYATSVGFKLCSGAQYLTDVELDGFFNGLLVQPQSISQLIEGATYMNVLTDTSLGDGMVFDATNGNIVDVRSANLWSGFNNGSGVRIKGSSGTISALRLSGSFRENGLYGVDESVNADMQLSGSVVTGNARGEIVLATAGAGCKAGDYVSFVGGTLPAGNSASYVLITGVNGSGAVLANGFQMASAGFYSAYPSNPVSTTGPVGGLPYHCATPPSFTLTVPTNNAGVHIAAGVSNWKIEDVTFGDIATNSTSQAASLTIDAGASLNFVYKGNTTESAAPNSGIAPVVNGSTARGEWDHTYQTSSLTAVAAGATGYFGPAGQQASTNIAGFSVPHGTITELGCITPSAPGSNQSYTFTLDVDGSTVGTAGAISGASSFNTGNVGQSVQVSGVTGDIATIQEVVSGAATTSIPSCYFSLAY